MPNKKQGEVATIPKRTRTPKVKSVALEFFAPEAKVVSVAGDFNQWNPEAHLLKRGKSGLWKRSLRLPPGIYQYRFVVDGQDWNEDPLNPNKLLNAFGSFNSVIEVG